MDSFDQDGNGAVQDSLPPPPPVPPNVVPIKAESEPAEKKQLPIPRPGLGTKGQKLSVLTNHFNVSVGSIYGHFFSLSYEDGLSVDGKGVGRKVIDMVQETYSNKLAGNFFAYDGEIKSLFTVDALPRNKLEFTVELEDLASNRNNGNARPDGHDISNGD